jgi:hypothetical protein
MTPAFKAQSIFAIFVLSLSVLGGVLGWTTLAFIAIELIVIFLGASIVLAPFALLGASLLGAPEPREGEREVFDVNGFLLDELDAWDRYCDQERAQERAIFREMFAWADLGAPIQDAQELDAQAVAIVLSSWAQVVAYTEGRAQAYQERCSARTALALHKRA